MILCITGGALFGSLYAGFIGWIKVRFGAQEVISTMMMNTIATLLVEFMVNYPLRPKDSSLAQTALFPQQIWLPKLINKTQLTVGFLIAVGLCILMRILLDWSVIGFKIRAAGMNKAATETAGIRSGRVIIIAMLISGGIAGILGSCQVLGVDHRLMAGFSSGYGFDGVAVAALGGGPVGVIVAGILFGSLRAGSMVLNRTTGIPTEFVDVIQALIVLLVAAPLMMRRLLHIDESQLAKRRSAS